jgi:hypothetical protein
MSAIDEFVVGQVYERLCAGGPDPFFAPEKRGNAPAYLRSCGELLEASPNSTMRQRARTLDDFIQVWESVELEASTESFLRIGFAILRGERHATLIRRFLIHELLLPLLEVEELATPSADVFPETSVDAWWQDCASLIAWADPQRCFSEASWAALDAVLSRVCRAGGLSEPQCAMLRSYKRLLERLAGCVDAPTD